MEYSKLYTHRGDHGVTSLFSGQRVSKAHPRIVAVGMIDAFNIQLGAARFHGIAEPIVGTLDIMQENFSKVMGLLCYDCKDTNAVIDDCLVSLEHTLAGVLEMIEGQGNLLNAVTDGQVDWVIYGNDGREAYYFDVLCGHIRLIEIQLVSMHDGAIEIHGFDQILKLFNALSKMFYLSARVQGNISKTQS
jgi:cob(I)alamin adenosyltransferase